MHDHIPVLAQEVMQGLQLKPGATVIDGTLGLGGHAALMLAAIQPEGKLIGFDRDQRNLDAAEVRLDTLGYQVQYIHDSFGNLASYDFSADAVLLDLGFSSVHVDDGQRGFSFQQDGPLDMRYDTRQALTAAEIVNMWSVDDLARIFRRYGEEPKAGLFAKAIVSARQSQSLTSTLQLADVIAAHQPRRGRLHPATKVFQALRVAVNDELGEVTKGLQALATTLKPGGRVAVITFHSLEDRLVKDFFKQAEGFTSLTKKPIVATAEEVGNNPRARSAKLRLAQKL